MANELSTIGVKLNWVCETTAGTRPTSGVHNIPGIKSIPGFDFTPNLLPVTDLSDEVERNIPGVIRRLYTLIIVNFLWVLFRADNIGCAVNMLKVMFGAAGAGMWDDTATFYLVENYSVLLLAAVVSIPLIRTIGKNKTMARLFNGIRPLFVITVLLLSVSFMVKGAYNPFIYFNF